MKNRDILATSRCRSLLSLLQQGGYALLCLLLSILSLDAQEVGEETARSPHLRAVGTGRIVVTTDTPIGQGIYFQIEAKGDIRFEGASYSGGSVLLIDEPQFVIYGDVTSIFFGPGQITSIDLSQSPTIEDLTCASNKLSQLTLTGARSLKYLNCRGNMLTHLELSDCNSLEILYCDQNQLSSLDVSHCGLLQELYCANNQLTHIALPNSPSFKLLECYANQIRGEAMTQLVNSLPNRNGKEAGFLGIMSTSPQEGNLCFKSDVRIATKKTWNARKIKLTSTNGGTYEPYEGEDGGETTGSVVTLITSKQIGGTITLAIGASSSVIIDGIEGTPTVDNWAYSYKITSQQITIRGDLTWLGCARNRITDIDVSKCPSLKQLDCSGNQLTHLDLSQNALLDQLSCGGNDLGTLDLSHCMLLENIWCRSAGLTSLQLPRTLSLVELSCSNNPLKDLDLTYYQHLEELYCVNNGLTSLDLSQNRALIKVYCGDNELTTLDLSHHKNLKILNCAKNKLTKLILPQGGDLSELDCSYNRLSQLDILQCRGLREVSCHMNRIQGEAMTQLVKGLSKDDPEWSKDLYAVSYRVDEENICLISDVAIARSKNWKVYMMQDEGSTSYEGLDMSASYPVILSSNRGGHITIVGNVDSKAVPCGTKITIQAICDSEAYELTALTANGTDILASKSFTIKTKTKIEATFTQKTDIDKSHRETMRLYPNPAREYIIVEGTLPATLVTLYCMEGMRLYEDKTDAEGTLRIDLSAYAEGTYLLRIADQTHRIIVQH